jgi:hypothetical protein
VILPSGERVDHPDREPPEFFQDPMEGLKTCEWCERDYPEEEMTSDHGATHCQSCAAKFAAEESAADDTRKHAHEDGGE